MKDNKDKKENEVVRREATKKSLEQIKTFLEQNEIRIPEDFDRKIIEAAKKFNGGRLPGISAIENTLRCCKYWKQYCINEEEYNKLICAECYNMAWIQCSVISTHKDLRSYVGNFCRVHEELLPECTTTVANTVDKAVLYEGMSSSEKFLAPLH